MIGAVPLLQVAATMHERPFCVYVIADLTNGKKYVGQTQNFAARMGAHRYLARRGSGSAINRAMAAHGVDNFVAGIVDWYETREDALDGERAAVALLDASCPEHGYNLTKGGPGVSGMVFSAEHKLKLSLAHMGQPGYWAGKRLPEHVVSGMRERALGRANPHVGHSPSDETRRQLSDALRGRVFSDDHRARITDGNRRAWARNRKPRVIGEACGSAKLTAAAVREIVVACDAGERLADVAKRYGVARRTVFDVVAGRTWKHVTGR